MTITQTTQNLYVAGTHLAAAGDDGIFDTTNRLAGEARATLLTIGGLIAVGFAVYSGVADAVDVAVFGDAGTEMRYALDQDQADVWHGHVAGIGGGARYGFRVRGPFEPARGVRCNEAKLLLDPYARAIEGAVEWSPAVSGDNGDDSAPYVPRSVVCEEQFDWSGDRAPRTALTDTIFYEAHVKGLTKLHPDVPPELRGTYAGVGHAAVIEHLQRLGITAIAIEV